MQGPRFGMIRIIENSSTDSVARVSSLRPRNGCAEGAASRQKVLTFADAMPNCGIWIEDEHAFDPSEVDNGNLDCMV